MVTRSIEISKQDDIPKGFKNAFWWLIALLVVTRIALSAQIIYLAYFQ